MALDSYYDVLIVGAGPSGCTAALYAHKHGLKALVIDKKEFPRDKICGDGFMPVFEDIFRELSIDVSKLLKKIHYKCTKADIYCNADFITLHGDIFLCPREVFDDFLFKVTESRVNVLQHSILKEVIFDTHENLATVDVNGTQKKIRCKYVIGADGASSVVRRLTNTPKFNEYAVASRSYFISENIRTEFIIKYTNEIAPGYFWQFQVAKNLINAGVLLFESNKQSDLLLLHKKYMNELSINGNEKGNVETWQLPFMNNLEELAGNGYILIGDAGGLIDPLFGHGIDTGMISGRLAAYTIFKFGENRQKVTEEYISLVRRKIYVKWGKNYEFKNNIHKYISKGSNFFFDRFTAHLQEGFFNYTL